MAVTHAATLTRDIDYHLTAQSFIWDWVCDREFVKYTRNGRGYYFQTPHLGSTAAAAAMAAVYVKANKDWIVVKENEALVKSAPPLQPSSTPCLSRTAPTRHAWCW
jgi:hypothetical protein